MGLSAQEHVCSAIGPFLALPGSPFFIDPFSGFQPFWSLFGPSFGHLVPLTLGPLDAWTGLRPFLFWEKTDGKSFLSAKSPGNLLGHGAGRSGVFERPRDPEIQRSGVLGIPGIDGSREPGVSRGRRSEVPGIPGISDLREESSPPGAGCFMVKFFRKTNEG